MSIPDLMKRAVEYGNTGSAIYDILSFGPSGNEVFEELSSLNKFKKIVQEL
jgi:hypothetical protein